MPVSPLIRPQSRWLLFGKIAGRRREEEKGIGLQHIPAVFFFLLLTLIPPTISCCWSERSILFRGIGEKEE